MNQREAFEIDPANGIFKCEHCGGKIVSGWATPENLARAEADFPVGCGEVFNVCDDCYAAKHGIGQQAGSKEKGSGGTEAAAFFALCVALALAALLLLGGMNG